MSIDPDISTADWIKSSYSGSGAGQCLEWAPSASAVRDSKTPGGPVLAFSPAAWAAFVRAVRRNG
ncbi:DUF397 domain-containing protein [Streptomyces klenkii]|uniref:DUF397 domain-containing protein n=1 Tax=Streptomyces klenkii TaxID=1420899 RepID=UPI0033B4BDBC